MSDTQQEAWLVDTDTDHEGAELQVHAPLLAPGEGVEHHLTSLSLARGRGQLIQSPSLLLDTCYNFITCSQSYIAQRNVTTVCGPVSLPQRLELVLQCDGFVKLLRVRNFKLGNHLRDITHYITSEYRERTVHHSTCIVIGISMNLSQESSQFCFFLRAADNLGQLNKSDTGMTTL